ncbi:MAG: hypothetical protein Q7S22_02290, partial [Candidatus Micrarchaeota archaeon]|nr:hypothetical protein [Candidatus Micrarchaeota archaeon]
MLFKASLLLLLILSSVLADSINISVNSQSCNNGGDLTSAITNLPQCTSDAIFNTLVSGLIYSA